MKQLVLGLSILGVVAWVIDAALVLLPAQLVQPLGVLSSGSFLQFGVPVLGLLVGILGAVYAGRFKDRRWASAFTILAVFVIGLLVVGFVVFIVFAFSYEPTLVSIGNTAENVGLLYPIVVFVVALVYALRAGAQSGKK